MYCPNCGAEILKHQHFCTKCGTPVPQDEKILWIKQHKKYICVAVCILVAFIISFLIISNNLMERTLYKIYVGDTCYYINEKGKEVLKLDNKYDSSGEFYEGRVFAVKHIKELDYTGMYGSYIGNIQMLDKKGKVIKEFNQPALYVTYDGETSASYLPEFFKGYALISLIENKDIKNIKREEQVKTRNVYINTNGKEVEPQKVPENIKKILNDDIVQRVRYNEDKDLRYTTLTCLDDVNEQCIGYVDKKGNIKIKPIFDETYLHCGDWYGRHPAFFNGRAAVFTRMKERESKVGGFVVLNGKYRYINKNGDFINNEYYDEAYPFYGKIAFVMQGSRYGFINRKGKWVWYYDENNPRK